MREILFRARDKNGKWRFGNLQKFELNGALFCEITAHVLTGESRSYLCVSSTVGQYTGLTDKHGTEIFEGDICKFYADGETSLYVCEWDKLNCRFAVRYIEAECGLDDLETGFAENCKVIGNIHGNFKHIGDDEDD